MQNGTQFFVSDAQRKSSNLNYIHVSKQDAEHATAYIRGSLENYV